MMTSFFYGAKSYQLSKLSSKDIRQHRSSRQPICSYKLGAVAGASVALTWGANLSKVTSVKHKNALLRVAHGDVYTNLKLFKFRLKDTPRCARCGNIETLNHKVLTCTYVAQIWRHTFSLTDSIRVATLPNDQLQNKVLGIVTGTNPLLLTIHAEVLSRILHLKNEENYTLHPKTIVKNALSFLNRREKSEDYKRAINDLLRDF